MNVEYLADSSIDDAGAKSMEDRCAARTRAILEEHKPEPIPGDLDRALTEILKGSKQS